MRGPSLAMRQQLTALDLPGELRLAVSLERLLFAQLFLPRHDLFDAVVSSAPRDGELETELDLRPCS